MAHVSLCVHGVCKAEEEENCGPVRVLERKSPVLCAVQTVHYGAGSSRIYADQSFNVTEGEESEDKPFKCNMCDKRFSRKLTLTRHIQTHSGVKPFECHLCGKRLSRKHVLMQHLKTHSVKISSPLESSMAVFQEAGSMYRRVDAV
jgi:hypothetical protein